MPIRVAIDIDKRQLTHVADGLNGRIARARDMRPALRTMQSDFEGLEDAVFRSQGGAIGVRWPALSATWRRYKQRRGLSPRMLEMAPAGQYGRLRAALTLPGAPYAVRRLSRHEMVAGTNLGIAKIHQKGGRVTIRGRTVQIPRRRFVSLRRPDRQRWLGYAGEYLFSGRTQPRRLP